MSHLLHIMRKLHDSEINSGFQLSFDGELRLWIGSLTRKELAFESYGDISELSNGIAAEMLVGWAERLFPESKFVRDLRISANGRGMQWETVAEWEAREKRELPGWHPVFQYDAYGESWRRCEWREIKDWIAQERLDKEGGSAWAGEYEPMVAYEDSPWPQWRNGIVLRRIAHEDTP
jgi:hypothetical protein